MVGGKLLLFSSRNSYMGFSLVWKLMTLKTLEWCNSNYFVLCHKNWTFGTS